MQGKLRGKLSFSIDKKGGGWYNNGVKNENGSQF